MNPQWAGWHLIGMFPEGEYADVGSWILHHEGEAALLEIPGGIASQHVDIALRSLDSPILRFATASHTHEDHFDVEAWRSLQRCSFSSACQFIHPQWLFTPAIQGEMRLSLGGEPLWLVKAPKHSLTDVVTIFRGVAMTGDIELGMLESVNREVTEKTKRNSMRWLRQFEERHNYSVHTIVSAHVNDVRCNVNWSELFAV